MTGITPSHPIMSGLLSIDTRDVSILVFIDSGSDACFIDPAFIQEHNIPLCPVNPALLVYSLNDKLLHRVTAQSVPLTLTIENHVIKTQFLVMRSPYHPVVLGYPWLVQHRVHIEWGTGRMLGRSAQCAGTCLVSAVRQQHKVVAVEEIPDFNNVPPEYQDLHRVFNKTRATALPPHRPYDCSIELLPGSMPPKGCLFLLSVLEEKP